MTQARLNAVGYCARMTEVGDWAFRYALNLARRHDAKLDIFFFPTSPCEEHEPRGRRGGRFEIPEADAIEIERGVRLYYDELLGDFVEAGFRLCLGDEAPELRRCLFDREYDVLVLGYENRLCPFGERTIEEFSARMQCPVVLVGPGSREEIYLNNPAKLWITDLGLDGKPWASISDVLTGEPARVLPTHEGETTHGSLVSWKGWFAFERELSERTGLNTCTCDDDGVRVTAHRGWSNLLCPVIRADRWSALTICGVPHEVNAALARREGRSVIDTCEAGPVRIFVPIFIGNEYRGLTGCCGALMEGSEVDVDFVASATGLSREAITNLSEEIPRITSDEANAMAYDLERRTAAFIARITEARRAKGAPS